MRTTFALGVALSVLVLFAACGQGNVFDLEPGQCFEDPGASSEISDVETVDCAEAHAYEVYALFDLPDGDFPGVDGVEDAAIQGCYLRFDDYVGREYETSELAMSWLRPTSSSWDRGDREVVCTLYDLADQRLIGSMKDSGV